MGRSLSIFIDESGDFGKYDPKSPFYILTLVFVKNVDLYHSYINQLRIQLNYIGVNDNYFFHIGPLIRNENEYKNYSLTTRKMLFNRLFAFTRKIKLPYYSLIIRKNKNIDKPQLMQMIYEKIEKLIIDNYEEFLKYEEIILYYDNGQIEISSLLRKTFLSVSSKFSINKNQFRIYIFSNS